MIIFPHSIQKHPNSYSQYINTNTFCQPLHLTALFQLKSNSPKKSQYLHPLTINQKLFVTTTPDCLLSFNPTRSQFLFTYIDTNTFCNLPSSIQIINISIHSRYQKSLVTTTILLRLEFNRYKDHNILLHLGYRYQIPFVIPSSIQIHLVPQRDHNIPAHLSRNISEIIAISLDRPAEFTPFSLARDPEKKELETIAFKWQRDHSFLLDGLLFGPVYANGKYTGTSSISIVSRCKFLPPTPWTGGDYKKSRNTRFHPPLLVTRPCILACVCVCVWGYIMHR